MIKGLWPTIGVGVMGAVAAELIRIAGAFREGKPPKGSEYVATVIYFLLGAGAAAFGVDKEQLFIEVMTLGAAFPLLFSAGIRAATSPSGAARVGRSLTDYLAGRF